MAAAEILKEIAQQVAVCEQCALHQTRKNSVPGEGPEHAEVMLIGEGPGFYENEQGRPFVGAAGKFLVQLLQQAGLNRENVFITNVVKCRPPGNRDPLPEELSACGDYLQRQIDAINPLVIVTLGRFSMARYMQNVKISAVHGKPRWMDERLIVPMFHPAAALHQPALKSSVLEDFSKLPQWIAKAKSTRPTAVQTTETPTPQPIETHAPHNGESTEDPPTQLSLF